MVYPRGLHKQDRRHHLLSAAQVCSLAGAGARTPTWFPLDEECRVEWGPFTRYRSLPLPCPATTLPCPRGMRRGRRC